MFCQIITLLNDYKMQKIKYLLRKQNDSLTFI